MLPWKRRSPALPKFDHNVIDPFFNFPSIGLVQNLGSAGDLEAHVFDITLRIVSVAAINSIEVADFAICSNSKVAGRAQGRTVDTMKISFDMIFGRIVDKLCYLWQIGTSRYKTRKAYR